MVSATACKTACATLGEDACCDCCKALIDSDTITKLKALGFSFATILALILQYGPQVVEIIKAIIDQLRPKTP